MSKLNARLIRKLRDETGAPVVRIKKVLDQFKGNQKKALEVLKKEGFEKVAKRADRATDQGVVVAYIHHNGKVAALLELLCETDFVAKNDLFKTLANELVMQIASMNPKNEKELLDQDFIKDHGKKIEDLVKDVIAKTGENIKIGKFVRIEVGQ